MTRGFLSVFRFVCGFSLLALPACQTGSANVSVRVAPETAEAAPLTTRVFEAKVSGTSDRRVSWSVIGPGSITDDGAYTAPPIIPPDSQNLIRIVATSVTGKTAEATVRIVPVPLEPTRGPTEGGTIVRITGEGFTAGTQVFFGGIEVNVDDMSVESSVLLRVKTPAREVLGAADVEIRVPGSEPLLYPAGFHYGATRIQMEGATLVSTCYNSQGDHVLVDATGDGNVDLVTVCYDSGVRVYAGDGAGGFTQSFGLAFDTMVDWPYGIEAGDLEGDGDLDFFVIGDLGAYVYRNDLGQSLAMAGTVPWDGPTYGYYIHLVTADLNGDLRADLAYNDYTNDRLVVKLSSGLGFGAPTYLPAENQPYGLVAAKVDADTDIDLVASYFRTLTPVPSTMGGISVHKNNGAGAFTSVNVPVRIGIYNVGVGDFDDDGDSDVIAVAANIPPAWIKNDSLGNFALVTDLTHVAGHYHQYSKPGTGDLDGDGVVDVFVHYTHLNQVQVWYGALTTGLAAAPVTYDTTNTPYLISAADVNGDSVADLVTAAYDVSEIYKGQGTRQFGVPKVSLGAYPTHVGLLPKVANTQALVAHPYGDPTYVGQYGAVSLVDVSTMLAAIPTVVKIDLPTGSSVERVHGADVTNDGVQDVLAVDGGLHHPSGLGSVWLLQGEAAGTFLPAVRVVATNAQMAAVSDIAWADLDADGLIDIVVARHDGNFLEFSVGAVQVMWGKEGGFDAPVTVLDAFAPSRLAISDLDGDNLKEIVATDSVANTLSVLTVSGRTVVETAVLDVGDQPSDILIADFDRDYVLDIAVQARYDLGYLIEIDVFQGLGYLTWDVPEKYRFYGFGYGLVYGDIDGDDLEDLAIPIDYPNSVAVLRGHDGGRFLEPEMALVPGFPVGVSLADIDGDSLIDLIVADQTTDSLRPLANRSK